MARTWQDNADEFGVLTKQGKDVRLALLVACSVEKGKGSSPGTNQYANRSVATTTDLKISAREFADRARSSADRVIRHLDAWNKLADTGLVPRSDDLEPNNALTLVIDDEALTAWGKISLGPTTLSVIKGNPTKVIEAVTSDPDFAKKIADDPAAVEAIITHAIEGSVSGVAIANAAVKRRATVGSVVLPYDPDDDPVEKILDGVQLVSELLSLIHEGAVKLNAAVGLWDEACGDLKDDHLNEAMPSLIEAEASTLILKSRINDIVASRTALS